MNERSPRPHPGSLVPSELALPVPGPGSTTAGSQALGLALEAASLRERLLLFP